MIFQAKMLAHQVLGKGLEILSPEARILLLLIEQRVMAACRYLKIERSNFRFSRKALRSEIGWDDAHLNPCLQQFLNANYLRLDVQGTSFAFELLYDSECSRRFDYVMEFTGPKKRQE
ncbi:MAG: primase [Parachlamydiales bacterium]|nr:primase [Parachlamydiales bacterium]